jgi:glycosyltransferase involved in cell wall biosynthesis
MSTRTIQRHRSPRVTIAIPTLDREKYLRLALESALVQTYPEIEVIVSNNASNDATAAYLARLSDPRVRVLTQPERLPIAQSWSACVSAATGEYFLLLSDDDLLEPTAIQELVAGFEADRVHLPSPGIVYCGGYIVDSTGNKTRIFAPSPATESARELAMAFFSGKRDLWFCSILFRTVDLLPGFSDRYTWAADSEAWIRAVFKHDRAVYVQKELVHYRVHENTTSSLSPRALAEGLQQLAEYAILCSDRLPLKDRTFRPRLMKAVNRLVMRAIPLRINEALRSNKTKALRTYASCWKIMGNPYGIVQAVAGIAFLFLPNHLRGWIRAAFKPKAD